jgi:hypothetical protein
LTTQTKTKQDGNRQANQFTDFEEKIVDRIREIKNSEYADKQAEWLKDAHSGDFHELTSQREIEETEENIQKIAEATVKDMEETAEQTGLAGETSQ